MTGTDPQALFAANTRLVNWVIERHYHWLRGHTREDATQEGLLALWQAALRFDPSKGVKFGTYAVTLIWGYVGNWLRDEREESGRVTPVGRPDWLSGKASHEGFDDVDFLDYLGNLTRGLHPQQKKVLYLRFGMGMGQREVGNKLGVTHQRINQIEREAVQRLRASCRGRDLL